MPRSRHVRSTSSRSCGPTRVTSDTSSPSLAAAAAPYSALPPRRQVPSGYSSRATCPIARRSVGALPAVKDMRDLAVLYQICAAFDAHQALALRLCLAPRAQQILPADDLRPDETPL